MISADQFLHCDVRLRQAKINPEQSFGGLGMNICGDFMQLPPVDKDGSRRSLAMALNDYGREGDVDQEGEVSSKTQTATTYDGPLDRWNVFCYLCDDGNVTPCIHLQMEIHKKKTMESLLSDALKGQTLLYGEHLHGPLRGPVPNWWIGLGGWVELGWEGFGFGWVGLLPSVRPYFNGIPRSRFTYEDLMQGELLIPRIFCFSQYIMLVWTF